MLEAGAALRTWRLAALPRPGETITAITAPDHRLLYLDYEGPISGNRGRVVRRERGTFTGQVQGEPPFVVQLQGERLRGILCLEHVEGDAWLVRMKEGG